MINKPNRRELRKIGLWLAGGETGLSSMSLCAVYLAMGHGSKDPGNITHIPYDSSDFNRCMGFLSCLDSVHRYGLIRQMGEIEHSWKIIYENWFTLHALWVKENYADLYKKMKEIGL